MRLFGAAGDSSDAKGAVVFTTTFTVYWKEEKQS
jgi:hypothetical protein